MFKKMKTRGGYYKIRWQDENGYTIGQSSHKSGYTLRTANGSWINQYPTFAQAEARAKQYAKANGIMPATSFPKPSKKATARSIEADWEPAW